MDLVVLVGPQYPGSPAGLVLVTKATSWPVGMQPPPSSEWRVRVLVAGVRCGCLLVVQGLSLLSPTCRVTVMLLLPDRWYRGLVVSSILALGLFSVSGSCVVGWRLPSILFACE